MTQVTWKNVYYALTIIEDSVLAVEMHLRRATQRQELLSPQISQASNEIRRTAMHVRALMHEISLLAQEESP